MRLLYKRGMWLSKYGIYRENVTKNLRKIYRITQNHKSGWVVLWVSEQYAFRCNLLISTTHPNNSIIKAIRGKNFLLFTFKRSPHSSHRCFSKAIGGANDYSTSVSSLLACLLLIYVIGSLGVLFGKNSTVKLSFLSANHTSGNKYDLLTKGQFCHTILP